VTAAEAYELITHGGASDFARVIAACESFGPYCLIGGLAVNCYVDPVYTLDADLVVVPANLGLLATQLVEQGFQTETRAQSVNAQVAGSDLTIQFITDERCQSFLPGSVETEVLGTRVRVACLEDVTQGKLWAWSDSRRRLSKRKKDELDLIRLAEAYPALKTSYPPELSLQLG
jgi:hypothetical protein